MRHALSGLGKSWAKRRTERAFRLNKRFPLYPPVKDLLQINQRENERKLEIVKVYNMEKMAKELAKIPVPKELIPGLTSPRRRPRAWDEEKILRRQALAQNRLLWLENKKLNQNINKTKEDPKIMKGKLIKKL